MNHGYHGLTGKIAVAPVRRLAAGLFPILDLVAMASGDGTLAIREAVLSCHPCMVWLAEIDKMQRKSCFEISEPNDSYFGLYDN